MNVALPTSSAVSRDESVSAFEVVLLVGLVVVGPLPFALDGWVVVDDISRSEPCDG